MKQHKWHCFDDLAIIYLTHITCFPHTTEYQIVLQNYWAPKGKNSILIFWLAWTIKAEV